MRISDWSSDVCSSDLCGVQTPKAAVALARRIQKTAGLAFMGLQAYQGGLQHKRSLLLRQRACHRAARAVRKYLAEFSRAGIECARVDRKSTRLNSSH